MMINGKWESNISCRVCGHRHPARRTCDEAAAHMQKAQDRIRAAAEAFASRTIDETVAVPMILFCPYGHRHIDEGEFATKPHHTHACQTCGVVWRPALVDTVGVQFLPGFKNVR